MTDYFRNSAAALGIATTLLWGVTGLADSPNAVTTSHGIAMHGLPALAPDFVSLPQVNPQAPKGGKIVMGELGGFDSLNPYTILGRAPAWLSSLTVESLMARAWDEPFTLYGYLAQSLTTDEERSFVEFTLNPQARFADGSPVTVEDVLWSFDALAKSHPRYHAAHAKVSKAYQTGPLSLRFDFKAPDRELPLLLGWRPILKKADWEGRDLSASSMIAPMGSGPYEVAAVDPGRSVTFRKRADWWAKDLPLMRGQHNFDEVRIEYFTDAGVMFEAFKAGALSVYREGQPERWRTGYDFQRVTSGEVLKSEIPHARPAMMNGLAFNTRRALFADWRVRQALIDSFNFEFINTTLNAGAEPRVTSWFANSPLAMPKGPASGEVAALLAPYADSLPPDALSDLSLPVYDGSDNNRSGLRRADALLAEAGWTVQGGKRVDATGQPFEFDILLPVGSAQLRSAMTIWSRGLERLGIKARLIAVDDAQMTARLKDYDFDMTTILRANSLSPGTEQRLYWGASGVTTPGTRNIAGANSPAVEAMIEELLVAKTPEAFTLAVQALDRALMAGRYVIPLWSPDRSRLAHDARMAYPADRLPIYGDASGFLPEIWWQSPQALR